VNSRAATVLAFLAVGGATVARQVPDSRFRSGVAVVEVTVLVRDDAGRPVTDLRAGDVTVLENGVAQKIVAFERISLPPPPVLPADTPRRTVPRDVAGNEGLATARMFVLVLDALHIAPLHVESVRRRARQFVDEHIAPQDLAAVFSPGGLRTANQDFTNDKASLRAAIDRFSGTKLTSATVEREREARLNTIPLHGGLDPSDDERAGRARALTDTLQLIALHLERVEGRRKALLLFSEGTDYDISDVRGNVQRHASDVMNSLSRATGALMKANVALYAIDPRGLMPAAGEMLENPVHREFPTGSISSLGVETELRDAVVNLRHLAESTGGFSTSDRNDVTGSFDRIVFESSEYYLVGYTPEKPPKSGEFRRIDVRVSRPGVSVVARQGYTLPREAKPAGGAPTIAGNLKDLLASPLPKAGLPLRVQAIPFRGDGKRHVVKLVVEMLGADLKFADRRGRAEERLELALLTVDGGGKAGNGRSASIALSLTAEEQQRVRSTGVRWLSSFELPAGVHQLRVAVQATNTSASGMVTQTIDVPGYAPAVLSMSGVSMTSLPSVLMLTRGDFWLKSSLATPPTAARQFVAGDQVTGAVEIYVPDALSGVLDLIGEVEHVSGKKLRRMNGMLADGRPGSTREAAFAFNTAGLPPGDYVLRVFAAHSMTERVERRVPFEIVK
jgi:VWFA-related protein